MIADVATIQTEGEGKDATAAIEYLAFGGIIPDRISVMRKTTIAVSKTTTEGIKDRSGEISGVRPCSIDSRSGTTATVTMTTTGEGQAAATVTSITMNPMTTIDTLVTDETLSETSCRMS